LSDDGVFCVDEHDLEWSSYDGADAAAAGQAAKPGSPRASSETQLSTLVLQR